jgi:hypothetical protein
MKTTKKANVVTELRYFNQLRRPVRKTLLLGVDESVGWFLQHFHSPLQIYKQPIRS